MKQLIKNQITQHPSGVWCLLDNQNIQYSDGQIHEQYLEKIFSTATDFSSSSSELKEYIHDWPSEYHLSHRRAQLLSGFTYKSNARVLEVGCGCGAITRFLGETFDEVIAIEGSYTRAELAYKRTEDLGNVSILCAPFQEVTFREKFDIIFCIGVFEYSNLFVSDKDPYDRVLRFFRSLLNKNGVLCLAIENQFGLKYFSSCAEDHTQFMFDGIEDYPRLKNSARTFGYNELNSRMQQYFRNTDFYFPYPDYKIPDCILSKQFFSRVDASELIGRIGSRDYIKKNKTLFNESLAYKALARNNMLPFFANSFLIIASNENNEFIQFDQLGILYGTNRTRNFQTITRFIENNGDNVLADKQVLNPISSLSNEALTIRSVKEPWRQGESVFSLVAKKTLNRPHVITDVFSDVKQWLDYIHANSSTENGVSMVDGKFVDCMWHNFIISEEGCYFIDAELTWHKPIPVSVLLVRAIYQFLDGIDSMPGIESSLIKGRRISRIRSIAASLGIVLLRKDFIQFLHMEAKIAELFHGHPRKPAYFHLKNLLMGYGIYSYVLKTKNKALRVARQLKTYRR